MADGIKLTKTGINALTGPFRWIIVTGIVYFLASGRIDILRAWLYIVLYLVGSVISNVLLVKKVPELLNQRGKMQEGSKKWDKIVILLYFAFAILITPLTAGLDLRLNSFSLDINFLYLAAAFYVLSVLFSIWPMLHNPFFEGTVRIQNDKNHRVIDTGPYGIVRHPGYLGMLLGSLPIPFAFGSVFSFIPVFIMIVLVFVRTYFEDKTLQNELEGYKEYTQKVKYRLIPFIW
jgi:protein-S-isoprenylcysteine O-methyltransferase Ste14